MSLSPRIRILLVIAILLVALGACDMFNDDSNQPPITGRYQSVSLTVLTDTGAVDGLARGTYIEMQIKPDNRVEGLFRVSSEFTEDDVQGSRRITFAGTWAQPSDSTITFEHDADTFIRDTKWRIKNESLRANNGEVKAVLVPQVSRSS